MNPDLLIRGENESNSKFVSRIKEYVRTNPEAALLVEIILMGRTKRKR